MIDAQLANARFRASRRLVATAAVMALLLGVSAALVVPNAGRAMAATDRTGPSTFASVVPCRLVDSRLSGDPGRLGAGGSTVVDVAGRCGVPTDAVAAAVTVTAVGPSAPGFLTVYPTAADRPTASLVNYGTGDVVANHEFVRLGVGGALTVYSLAATDVVVDVMGYFVPAPDGAARSGRYVPVAQHRLLDTRETHRPRSGSSITIDPDVGADVVAVAINVTTTETRGAGFFSAYPAGVRRPVSSILNVSGAWQTRAASVVVPVSEDGIEIYTSAANHVIVDVTGYFTGPSAARSSDGLFVGMTPRRLVDSRLAYGATGGPRLWDDGAREFTVSDLVDGDVAAVAVNATVTGTEDMGYLIAHPARTPVPATSTVNYDHARHTAANFAVVGVSDHGLAVRATEATHVVLDLTGWFTGPPATGSLAAPRNEPPDDRRVTIISDSGMAGIRWNGALGGFRGFEAVAHLESCRRLVRASCRGREGYHPPPAASQIESLAPVGPEEMLVIAVGYNDWHASFAEDFDIVVDAARRKGFHHIVWVDYRSSVGYRLPGGEVSNYGEMNRILAEKLASGRFPDVRRWALEAYTAGSVGWFRSDGVHQTQVGAWGVADWISRHVRAFDDRPCVQPWVVGGWIDDPCPDPDSEVRRHGLPDVGRLYPVAAG